MILLTAEQLTKSYAEKKLFEKISFGINEGDKIGVIGINGTGKSTLLKIIAQVEQADEGIVTKMNHLQIGYLPQSPVFQKGATVLNQVFYSENPVMRLVKEYEDTSYSISKNQTPQLLEKLALLSEQMDKEKAWSYYNEAQTILTKLGITDFYQQIDTLSGGQKKRVALASALITPVDLLILDEPTNHIDNHTIDWLETYLERYPKSVFMVTHDRYFLDRVANKIFELDHAKLYVYEANYSQFLEKKIERQELEQSSERKRQNFLRREIEWIRRGAQARSTKQKARISRYEKTVNEKAPVQEKAVEMNVASSRLGRKTIEAKNICKSYQGICYINQFSYLILRNDRIGIIGQNGCGKTTLLKILSGQMQADSGEIEIGQTVKIGVFGQENGAMDEKKRVIDYLKEIAEFVPTQDGTISASQMLEKFLFPPQMQFSPIEKLSGGEKRRLYLLYILMGSPNILFLDEPTNDLDTQTLSILEEYLEQFMGAVVAVSHDRYFLDRVAGRIFAFEQNGTIKQYEGGYSDYLQQQAAEEETTPKEDKEKSFKKDRTKNRLPRMTYQQQRDLESIGGKMGQLEEQIANLVQEISNVSSNYVLLQELTQKKEELEQQLEQTMEYWIELTELAEEIEKAKKEAKQPQ